MKKLFLVLFVFSCVVSFGQTFPNNPTQGNDKTNNIFLGAATFNRGAVIGATAADTTAINALPYVKNTPGIIVRTAGDIYWVRDAAATKWKLFVVAGGSPTTDTTYWSLNGTTVGSMAGIPFLGTMDNYPLNLGTNGQKRISIKGDGIQPPISTVRNLGIDTASGYLSYSNSSGGGSMVYPANGIPNSTGSAWGTSYGTTGSGTQLALSNSPSFTGNATALTQAANDSSTKIATTAFVDGNYRAKSDSIKVKLATPLYGVLDTVTGKTDSLGIDIASNTADGYVTSTNYRDWYRAKEIADSLAAVSGGGSMVYPGAGIAVSTGPTWGTSIPDNSANWNTVLNRLLFRPTTVSPFDSLSKIWTKPPGSDSAKAMYWPTAVQLGGLVPNDTINMKLRPIAGKRMQITGTYPNLTFNAGDLDSLSTAYAPTLKDYHPVNALTTNVYTANNGHAVHCKGATKIGGMRFYAPLANTYGLLIGYNFAIYDSRYGKTGHLFVTAYDLSASLFVASKTFSQKIRIRTGYDAANSNKFFIELGDSTTNWGDATVNLEYIMAEEVDPQRTNWFTTAWDYELNPVYVGTKIIDTVLSGGASIALTTTGTSGAATFSSGTLNIPQYQAAGSYAPATSGTGILKGDGSGGFSTATSGTDYLTGTVAIANGGTGQTTANAAMNALLPSKTGNSLKFLRVNSGETDYELTTLAGGGDALTANPLSQFAATTSSQLSGVLSDESGTDKVAMTTDAALTTPTIAYTASPSTPSTDRIKFFDYKVGGRDMVGYIDPAGLDNALQPMFIRNSLKVFQPAGNSTTMTVLGAPAPTATGTATAANVATTNRYTQIRGIEYLVTVATTTAVAGFREAAVQNFFGNSAGNGGFHFVCRFGPATGVSTTTNRCFVGMSTSTAAPTDVEPSTLLNSFGVGWDAADANIQFMTNDGTGTATKTSLGIAVPAVDRTSVYELSMFCAPNSTTVTYTFKDLAEGGSTVSGTVTTDLPAVNTYFGARGWMSVGGTSSVIGIALKGLYLESDY